MTHSGGMTHRVGDDAQRYIVSVFDELLGDRVPLGYTNSLEDAQRMAAGAQLRPSWKAAWVTDRQPVQAPPASGSG